MLDGVLTVIAATDSEIAIELAVAAMRHELLRVGARVGQPDWLAFAKACDLFFSDVAFQHVDARMRKLLAERFPDAKLDFIVQEAANRRKRLIVADLESTLIENEMLDDLADLIGARDKVAEITRQAMNGEIDFAAALRARAAQFKGLAETALEEAAAEIRLMPGARVLVTTSRAHGVFVALATGGFSCFVRHVQKKLDFDAVFANELVVDDDKLTGEVREPILTREDKLGALTSLAAKRDIPLRLTLAVGDGANDLPMLQAAGLGVAYHAKPAVAQRAAHRLTYCDLTGVLYAQGYRAAEFAAV